MGHFGGLSTTLERFLSDQMAKQKQFFEQNEKNIFFLSK